MTAPTSILKPGRFGKKAGTAVADEPKKEKKAEEAETKVDRRSSFESTKFRPGSSRSTNLSSSPANGSFNLSSLSNSLQGSSRDFSASRDFSQISIGNFSRIFSLDEEDLKEDRPSVEFKPSVRVKEIHSRWSNSERQNMFYSEDSMAEIQYQAYCEEIGVDPEEYWEQMCAEEEERHRLEEEEYARQRHEEVILEDSDEDASGELNMNS